MNLAKYLNEECIQIGAEVSDKSSVLRTIARLSKNCPVLQNISEEEILQGLIKREKLGSTGFDNGIAIPHCAFEDIPDAILGVLTVPDGVDFDSADGEPTKLVVFIIASEGKRNEHISILSAISSILRLPENVQEILSAKNASAVREIFLRHTESKKEPKLKKEYQQFTAIVQHEELFEDILNVFTEIGDCYVSVLEAKNAREYLYSLPLFHSFWNEEQTGFNRIILGLVSKALSNETARRLDMVLERAGKKSGVLVFFQDIAYMNGSLDL